MGLQTDLAKWPNSYLPNFQANLTNAEGIPCSVQLPEHERSPAGSAVAGVEVVQVNRPDPEEAKVRQ